MNAKNTCSILGSLLLGGLLLVGTAAVAPIAEAGGYHSGDYGDYYITKKGEYAVRAVTGGYEWEASNGEGGRTDTKKEAKQAARDSLEENPPEE